MLVKDGFGLLFIESSHLLEYPLVVFRVVGFEEELAAGDQHVFENVEKLLLNQSAFVVPGFGPWVGAEEVEA